jgi:copper chaperone CopZ
MMMGRKNRANIVLVVAVVVLIGVFGSYVRVPVAADAVAVLGTAGMTCGACGAAIEKALQAHKGVASVEVDAQGGKVVVGYDSKQTGPDALAAAVTGAGYRSRVEKSLTAEQYRALTGRNPGVGDAMKTGCGCGAGARWLENLIRGCRLQSAR